jgi:hypothetical protein
MVTASKDLTARIRLLKDLFNQINTCKQNGRKVDTSLLKDFNSLLKYTKLLYKKELLNTNIKDLL